MSMAAGLNCYETVLTFVKQRIPHAQLLLPFVTYDTLPVFAEHRHYFGNCFQ